MRRALGWTLLGLGAYLIALLVTFPAGQAYALAWQWLGAERLPVTLGGIDGSLWRGRADSIVYRGEALGSGHWRLRPASLLGGELGADVRLLPAQGALSGRVTVDPQGATRLAGVSGRLPAAWVVQRLPALPVTVGGQLTLNLEQLQVAPQPGASGTIVWNGASITAPQALALGDLKLVLAPRPEGGVQGTVSDAGGPLAIDGEVVLEPDGRYRIQTRLGARQADSELAQMLQLLGRPGADGRVPFTLNGRL